MNITTATPAEIDTEIARLSGELAQAEATIDSRRDAIKRMSNSAMRDLYGDKIAAAEQAIAAAQIAAATARAALLPLDAEFDGRGGWTRYYLVDANNGHVHPSTSCSTCFITTAYYWLTTESGKTAEEVVELAGERACTVCFPWAPVDALKRPSSYQTSSERERAEARQARQEKAEAKAAKAKAAAITAADGGKLLDVIGHEITTERQAQMDYFDAAINAAYYGDQDERAKDRPSGYDAADWDANGAWNFGRYETVRVATLAALAAKHGLTVEAQEAEFAKKLSAKIRKARKEADEYRARFAR
jgi:hypothetical protein